jgi:hypothetical protein
MPSLSTSVVRRPHLWVTSGPENLVYRGYQGNRMTINSEARASMLISRLTPGRCIARRGQDSKVPGDWILFWFQTEPLPKNRGRARFP